MTQDRNDQPTASAGSAVWRTLRDSLHCAAGASPQELAHLGQRCSMQYATLGLVFVLNFAILAAAWMKVGYAYWGVVGVLVPGLLVPAAFVFGIDRLVAMRPRRLEGELAPYSPSGPLGARWEPMLRIGSAAALATLTTLTFMMSQAGPSIQRLQNEDARRANAPIRTEIVGRIDAQHTLKSAHAQARERAALAERDTLIAQRASLQQRLEESARRAHQAREAAAMEAGGIGNRLVGRGPRFAAQEQIAEQNAQAAGQLRTEVRQAAATLQSTEKELGAARAAAAQATAEHHRELAGLDDLVRIDARYVAPVRGLFADTSAFLRLFSDPQEGPGFWLLAIVGASVLFCLECMSLLALALNPSSPLDVLRAASNRCGAARIVANSEIEIARERARMPAPIRVADLGQPAPGAASERPRQRSA